MEVQRFLEHYIYPNECIIIIEVSQVNAYDKMKHKEPLFISVELGMGGGGGHF